MPLRTASPVTTRCCNLLDQCSSGVNWTDLRESSHPRDVEADISAEGGGTCHQCNVGGLKYYEVEAGRQVPVTVDHYSLSQSADCYLGRV